MGDLEIQKQISNKINTLNTLVADQLPDLLTETLSLCLKLKNQKFAQPLYISQVIDAFKSKAQRLPTLTSQEILLLVQKTFSLSALAALFTQMEMVKSAKIDNPIRERIRILIDSTENKLALFHLEEVKAFANNPKKLAEFRDVIRQNCYFLLEYAQDFYYFDAIYDILVKAVFLIASNKTVKEFRVISTEKVIEKLIQHVKRSQTLSMWTTILDAIFHAASQNLDPQDVFQPLFIARLILKQIPYLKDLYVFIGSYLLKSHNINLNFFLNLLRFGVTSQSFEISLLLLIDLHNQDQLPLLNEMRFPLLARYAECIMQVEAFIPLFECIYFLVISPMKYSVEIEAKHKVKVSELTEQNRQLINNIILQFNKLLKLKLDEVSIIKMKHRLQKFKKHFQLYYKNYQEFTKLDVDIGQSGYDQQMEESIFWGKRHPILREKENKKLVGLKNLLNTCYLNSFLQALYASANFKNYLINQPVETAYDYFFQNQSLKYHLQKCFIFLENIYHDYVEFVPLPLKRALRQPYSNEVNQQDAGEFGSHLLEDLEQQLSEKDYKAIKEIFVGKSKSVFTCKNCNRQTDGPEEDFFQISLNFSNDLMRSYYCTTERVSEMLKRTQQEEPLEFTCEKCKWQSKCTKKLHYQKWPQNLILLLNRFQFKNNLRTKIKHSVEIEEEIRLSQGLQPLKFRLYSMIVHMGQTPDAGHYTTYSCINDCWYLFDDSVVTRKGFSLADFQKSFTQEFTPYILFYKKDL